MSKFIVTTTTEARVIRQKVHVRLMIDRDLPDVLQIERESFEFPWAEADFVRLKRQRNCTRMVIEVFDGVVAYIYYELHRERFHILNFAVAASVRRQGIGRIMVDKLVDKLSATRRTRITLEVRETNLPAQLFFQSCGFLAVGTLKDFYDDTPEDAYTMECCLPGTQGTVPYFPALVADKKPSIESDNQRFIGSNRISSYLP